MAKKTAQYVNIGEIFPQEPEASDGKSMARWVKRLGKRQIERLLGDSSPCQVERSEPKTAVIFYVGAEDSEDLFLDIVKAPGRTCHPETLNIFASEIEKQDLPDKPSIVRYEVDLSDGGRAGLDFYDHYFYKVVNCLRKQLSIGMPWLFVRLPAEALATLVKNSPDTQTSSEMMQVLDTYFEQNKPQAGDSKTNFPLRLKKLFELFEEFEARVVVPPERPMELWDRISDQFAAKNQPPALTSLFYIGAWRFNSRRRLLRHVSEASAPLTSCPDDLGKLLAAAMDRNDLPHLDKWSESLDSLAADLRRAGKYPAPVNTGGKLSAIVLRPAGNSAGKTPEIEWESVFCDPVLKSRLAKIADDLQVGKLTQRGILLHGSTGGGKTFLAQALAARAKCSFFQMSTQELQSKWVNHSAELIREKFEHARAAAPAILFLDEIESLAAKRNASDHRSETGAVNQLLCCLDGAGNDPQKPVLVIAATNNFSSLDDAVIRKGRLGDHIEVKASSPQVLAEMLEFLLAKQLGTSAPQVAKDEEIQKALRGCTNAAVTAIASAFSEQPISKKQGKAQKKALLELVAQTAQSISKSHVVDDVDFEKDLFVGDKTKKEIEEALQELWDGDHPPQGILLYGPPGTGKTFLARAMSAKGKCRFFAPSAGELEHRDPAVVKRHIEEIFYKAKEWAPSIIFLDEIDSIASHRHGYSSERSGVVNTLLTCMQGFSQGKGERVLVVGATNFISKLDPALTRPGRLGRHIEILPPPPADAVKMLKRMYVRESKATSWPWGDTCDDMLLQELSGTTQSKIVEIAKAILRKKTEDKDVMLEVVREQVWGDIEESPSKPAILQQNWFTARHEAGHALADFILLGHIPRFVSVQSRRGSLGFVAAEMDSAQVAPGLREVLSRLIVFAAGRAAESDVRLKAPDGILAKVGQPIPEALEPNSGAGSDLSQMTRCSAWAVGHVGLDKAFGSVSVAALSDTFPHRRDHPGDQGAFHTDLSDHLYARVRAWNTFAAEAAAMLLEANQPALLALAEKLFMENQLSHVQMKEFFGNEEYFPSAPDSPYKQFLDGCLSKFKMLIAAPAPHG